MTEGDVTFAAVFSDKKLIALEADSKALPLQAGARFIGKITRHKQATHSLELDLGAEAGPAFLDIGKRALPAGTPSCEVEWRSPALGSKLPEVRFIGFSDEVQPRLISNGHSALLRAKAAFPTARLIDNPTTAMCEGVDLAHQLEALQAPTVPLPRGGSLQIDTTEACTVIDVNGDGAPAMMNRYAVLEAARQCRLRNIGGIILIDLIGTGRTIPPEMLETFKNAVATDPCKVDVYGLTKLGFLEATRHRSGYPLARVLTPPQKTTV